MDDNNLFVSHTKDADDLETLGHGDRLNIKLSYQYSDPHVKDKTVRDRLIFNMGIPIPGKDGLYAETGLRPSADIILT